MRPTPSPLTARTALVVAHPGHELRVHRWLELAKPTVYVLTDGSGRTERSRLASTTHVLTRAGAEPGAIYGWCSDVELYAAVLAGDTAFLLRLVHALVSALGDLGAECVVGDAMEGFNPSHDLCRFLINAAVSLLRQRTQRELGNFDFLLDGSPRDCPADLQDRAVRVELEDAALERKLAAAQGYPELRAEAETALARFGSQLFRTEWLRPVADWRQGLDRMAEEPPHYERVGEGRVSSGHYRDVIRYRENVRPLVKALWRDVGLNGESNAPLRHSAPARRVTRP
jgi:hypothetical protein